MALTPVAGQHYQTLITTPIAVSNGWMTLGERRLVFLSRRRQREKKKKRGMQEGEEEKEEEEGEKDRQHEPATLRLTIVCLDTMLPATQLPSLLAFRAAACSASTYRRSGEDRNINIDAWSLQFIFNESLKVIDQLQQLYDHSYARHSRR